MDRNYMGEKSKKEKKKLKNPSIVEEGRTKKRDNESPLAFFKKPRRKDNV